MVFATPAPCHLLSPWPPLWQELRQLLEPPTAVRQTLEAVHILLDSAETAQLKVSRRDSPPAPPTLSRALTSRPVSRPPFQASRPLSKAASPIFHSSPVGCASSVRSVTSEGGSVTEEGGSVTKEGGSVAAGEGVPSGGEIFQSDPVRGLLGGAPSPTRLSPTRLSSASRRAAASSKSGGVIQAVSSAGGAGDRPKLLSRLSGGWSVVRSMLRKDFVLRVTRFDAAYVTEQACKQVVTTHHHPYTLPTPTPTCASLRSPLPLTLCWLGRWMHHTIHSSVSRA